MSTFTTQPPASQPPPDMTGPPPVRRPAVILAAVAVAVILSAFGLLNAAGTLYEREWNLDSRYPTSGLHGVVIEASAGDITVRTTNSPDVVVQRKVSAAWARPKPSGEVSGGVVRLADDCPSWVFGHCQVSYVISVPADFTVDAHSGAGDIEVVGVSGQMKVDSGAGDVSVRDFDGTEVAAESSAGDVEVTCDAQPDRLRAVSSAGDVTVGLPDGSGPYDVETSTDAGDTTSHVREDPAARSRVTAVSSAGDVTVRYR
jgi:hypothetical protein